MGDMDKRFNVPSARIDFPEEDRKEALQKIDEVLKSGMLTLGKNTKEFEENFSGYVKTEYAVAVNSGTAALEICARAMKMKGSSVIVPTNTFCATAAAVMHAGCRVIFADIGDDLCLDPDSLQSSIRKDTKAVILVHIAGNITKNISAIKDICEDKNILLIEDAAHAAGSAFDGKKAGSLGNCAAFSFYPTKVMTSGEGGMITTDSEEIYKKAIVLRDQGKESFNSNNIVELGYNWRMSEVSAIIGIQQLKRLDEFIAKRKKVAEIYDKMLKKTERIRPLGIPRNADPNYYKYVAFIDEKKDKTDRSMLKRSLKEKFRISMSGEVYDVPCHMQPVFKEMFGKIDLPNAERLCKSHICLPIYPSMKREEAEYVANSLSDAIGDHV